MSIGQKIKTLREGRGLTQQDLACYLEVKQQTIDAWERGVANPRKNNIDKLADFFRINAGYFFNEDNNKIIPNVFNVTEHERQLLEKYRQLSEAAKLRIDTRIETEYDVMNEVEAEKARNA